jgi:hypothetical protein
MGYGCFLPRADYSAPIALDGVISRNGPYLNPPEQAVVLCCNEKSLIQAFPRSQPSLLVEKFILEFEGDRKNCDFTRWDRFTDIKDIKKEMLKRLESHFEKWLNP